MAKTSCRLRLGFGAGKERISLLSCKALSSHSRVRSVKFRTTSTVKVKLPLLKSQINFDCGIRVAANERVKFTSTVKVNLLERKSETTFIVKVESSAPED